MHERCPNDKGQAAGGPLTSLLLFSFSRLFEAENVWLLPSSWSPAAFYSREGTSDQGEGGWSG